MEQPQGTTAGEIGPQVPVPPESNSPLATPNLLQVGTPQAAGNRGDLTDRQTAPPPVAAAELGAEGAIEPDRSAANSPQVCDSTEEQTPPTQVKQEVVDLTVSSPEGATAQGDSTSAESRHLREQVTSLKRRQSEYLKQLAYFAEVVQKLGDKASPPPTPTEAKQRRKFVESGLWPSSLHDVETMSYKDLGQRLGDYYQGCSSHADD